MSDSNRVTMNIPDGNPLFDWVWDAARKTHIEEVKISVGNISARLLFAGDVAIRSDYVTRGFGGGKVHERQYMETEWVLAPYPYCVPEGDA